MKRINIILLLTMLLGSAFNLIAQTLYYTTAKELKETGYSYQCDLQGGRVTLYDKNNKFTYEDMKLKDGSPIPDELNTDLLWGNVTTIEDDNWTPQKCYSIVENALSEYKIRSRDQHFPLP